MFEAIDFAAGILAAVMILGPLSLGAIHATPGPMPAATTQER